MRTQIEAFVASAAEAFALRGPLHRYTAGLDAGLPPQSKLPARQAASGCFDVELREVGDLERLGFPDAVARSVLWVGPMGAAIEPMHVAAQLRRTLTPGGAMLIASRVASHAWPLTPQGVERLLDGMAVSMVGWQGGGNRPHTVFGLGFKAPLDDAFATGADRFLEGFPLRRAGWTARLIEVVRGWAGGRRGLPEGHRPQFTVRFRVESNTPSESISNSPSSEMVGGRLDLMH